MTQVLQYLLMFFCCVNHEVIGKKHGSRHSADNGVKIVGGHNVTLENVPYQTFLLMKKKGENVYFTCGGSIVNSKTVLTAAHCIKEAEWVQVRIGSTDRDHGGKTYIARNLVQHPEYNSKTSDWDVGIVKLDQPMDLAGANAKTIKMAESGATPDPGTILLATGWGAISENGPGSQSLLGVKVPVVSYEDCRKTFTYISSRMICAGSSGKSPCGGDSGGPAVSEKTGAQVGVVSFGIGCARPNYPGVFANVAEPSISNFIRDNTVV